MKILIASDVHGSATCLKNVIDKFIEEKADKLVLLGDVYNHGPRNPFPEGYAPMEVADILNEISDKLLVVKGNCDSAVDTMISNFDFVENLCVCIGGKTAYLTHGHVYNKDAMPKTKFDLLIYGHYHTGFIKEENGTIIVNAGSISLPKCDTPASYLILTENEIALKDLDGKIIQTRNF